MVFSNTSYLKTKLDKYITIDGKIFEDGFIEIKFESLKKYDDIETIVKGFISSNIGIIINNDRTLFIPNSIEYCMSNNIFELLYDSKKRNWKINRIDIIFSIKNKINYSVVKNGIIKIDCDNPDELYAMIMLYLI